MNMRDLIEKVENISNYSQEYIKQKTAAPVSPDSTQSAYLGNDNCQHVQFIQHPMSTDCQLSNKTSNMQSLIINLMLNFKYDLSVRPQNMGQALLSTRS